MSEETTTPDTSHERAPREMVKVIPDKPATPKPVPPKAEAKAGGAGAPKKPVKKVAKSWPYVNALLTTLSLTATLGGWAHFTLAEARLNEQTAVSEVASQAVVAAAPPTLIPPTPTYTLNLPPIPTVVPPQTFTINTANTATVDTAAGAAPAAVAPAAPIPTAVTPAAPVLRSVTAPPPVVSAPAPAQVAPAPAAPPPVAATGTSRR
jgi:hypothetical protein